MNYLGHIITQAILRLFVITTIIIMILLFYAFVNRQICQ